MKSRALQNFILYNRLTGESGTSSYELDLPNGGRSYVIGNVLEQGPRTENSAIVAYGEEGALNPNSELYFVNNTVVNNHSKGTFVKVGTGAAPALMQNNIFSGPGILTDQPEARLSHNLTVGALFVDAGNYDYHLKSDSRARKVGASPGSAIGYSLQPIYEYVHPSCFAARQTTATALDAGAFEFRSPKEPAACSKGELPLIF